MKRLIPQGLWALTNRDLKKWYKVPFIFIVSLIQPLVWLALFGKAMNISGLFNSVTGLPKEIVNQLGKQIMLSTFGTSDYFSFLAVGMLSFISLFTAMFSGMSIVWDRRLGFLDKVLSTPVARGVIPMAKILATVIRALAQAAIVLMLAIILGMDSSHITPFGLIVTFTALFLLILGFASLFVTLALRSTSWESQMAIMNLLNLPILFSSNAMFPISYMPEWLQPIARINPISYSADISRQFLLNSPGMVDPILGLAYLTTFAITLLTLGIVLSWRYLSK
ncbi:Daunorubicin/doxorubicin resistance ABC transporter permease protein DrrB [archaeon HR06]|nr:Daunorubicin/doxorubicin resistance ABC transporter permease protein DrrB [archaeon HR06]